MFKPTSPARLRTWMIAAALATTVGASLPALAQDAPPPPPPHPHHCGGPGHDGWQRHHRKPPMMRALHKLNLSDAQKQQIRQIFKSGFASMRPQMQALMQQRRAFTQAVPGTPEFNSAYTSYAQAAAAAAEARVQHQADLRTQIYGVLSDDQRAQLAKMQQEMIQHREQRRGEMPPPPAS